MKTIEVHTIIMKIKKQIIQFQLRICRIPFENHEVMKKNHIIQNQHEINLYDSNIKQTIYNQITAKNFD